MKPLKWGLIGAGDIVRRRVAPAMVELDNCEVVAVSRDRAELAESFAAEFGIGRWYAEWREMLADESVDAVYIATPVYLHAEQTIAAAEAGKHILCEKPMAMDVRECDAMIAAARANGVKLGVAYYRRFYPVLERVRQVIASGSIGKPVFAQMNAFEYVDLADDDPRHWFIEKAKSGGGPMMDFGCHRLEVLTELFGDVSRIESLTANVFFQHEVEDTAAVLLQFASGTLASVVVTHAARESQDTLDIFGTAGSIHITTLNKGGLRIVDADGERTESHLPSHNFHLPLIRDFADAVISDREPRANGDTGRTIAAIADKIYGRAK